MYGWGHTHTVVSPLHKYKHIAQTQQALNGSKVTKSIGNLLYHMATRYKGFDSRSEFIVNYICAEKLTSEPQLTGMAGLVHSKRLQPTLHIWVLKCSTVSDMIT